LEERALDLLEAAYLSAEYQERGERLLLLTFLDGEVALSVGLNPTSRENLEGRTYHRAVDSLIESGAVEVPDIPDQDLAGVTFYEITARGVEILRDSGRIT
jgi:hypothetical protein